MSNISPRPEQSTTTEAELLTSINELSNSAAGEFIRKAGGVFVNATPGVSEYAALALDNLASVAINTSLISDTDDTDNLGSTDIK